MNGGERREEGEKGEKITQDEMGWTLRFALLCFGRCLRWCVVLCCVVLWVRVRCFPANVQARSDLIFPILLLLLLLNYIHAYIHIVIAAVQREWIAVERNFHPTTHDITNHTSEKKGCIVF